MKTRSGRGLSTTQENMPVESKPTKKNNIHSSQYNSPLFKVFESKLAARLEFLEHYNVSTTVIRDVALQFKVEFDFHLPFFYASDSWIKSFKKKKFPHNPKAFSEGKKILGVKFVNHGIYGKAVQAIIVQNKDEKSILNYSFDEDEEQTEMTENVIKDVKKMENKENK